MPRVKGTGGKGATKLCLKMIDSLIATDIGIYILNHCGSRSAVKNE